MSTKIPEDLMCNVRVFKVEEAMQHLERSFAPMVQFREDIEQMRQDAHAARLVHIKTAMEIIYHEVAGLLVRPEFYTEEKEVSTEKPLKERQIETAQAIVDLIAEDRPEHKGKKVVEVEATEMHNEVIIRFNDWTTTKVVGLFAQKILEGRSVVL